MGVGGRSRPLGYGGCRPAGGRCAVIRDDLVRAVTAFRSWDAMKAELDRGYVPTLLSRRGRLTRELSRRLGQLGYRVYVGK